MEHEAYIRLGAFLGVFAFMATWELVAPRRALTTSKSKRWFCNLAILALNPVAVRLTFPVLPVGLAWIAQERGWGLLNQVMLPTWAEIIIGLLLLDFIIYLQHVFFHAIPVLWRLHMVHHADLDLDVTSGLRFHPLEIILSMGIKLVVVGALGPAPAAVLVFETVLNATAMFSHSNVAVPLAVDEWLRLLVVTPDMHRVHHSVILKETNSNFGFNVPWWDRLLGTYRDQPLKGHADMVIGLARFRDSKLLGLGRLIKLPFLKKDG